MGREARTTQRAPDSKRSDLKLERPNPPVGPLPGSDEV